MGRHDEAIAHNKRAKELDPLTPYIRSDLGWAYNHARRYDEAIAECKQIPEIDPKFHYTYWCLGFAYWQKGMLEEAVAAYERGVELEPGDLYLKADLAIVYAAAGKKAQAQTILEEFEEKARREYVSPYALAMAHMAVGDLDGTFAWLDKMYEERTPWLIWMNEHAPLRPPARRPALPAAAQEDRVHGAEVHPRDRFRLTRPPVASPRRGGRGRLQLAGRGRRVRHGLAPATAHRSSILRQAYSPAKVELLEYPPIALRWAFVHHRCPETITSVGCTAGRGGQRCDT